MLRRNLIPIYCALLAVVLLPIGLFFVAQHYQANLQIGLATVIQALKAGYAVAAT
ncbi:hypothetical protein [Limosilactobacillus ingluviei]|uniref:hypothetical protein n=1 Tax=Limosilactobacillus ingluviei TaxID=148604 RepID=UPI001EF71583|nr:hypothetical protein [Limosilactobacillus ingluviei]